MVIRNFINEFVLLFTAIKDGIVFIFYGFPLKIVDLIKNKGKTKKDAVDQNISDAVTAGIYGDETGTSGEKDLKGIVSEWIEKTYNNLPWVKEAREKKEANLNPLVLDVNGADAVRTEEKQVYKYIARDSSGKLVEGYFPAFSKVDVFSYLTDEKMTVYEIATDKGTNF